MSKKAGNVKYVTLSKPIIVKHEISSEEESTIPCPLCSKEFFSDAARNNHIRMEHTNAFLKEPDKYQQVKQEPQPQPQPQQSPSPEPGAIVVNSLQEVIKEREEALLSSMKPATLQALASSDVEYILVKSENVDDILESKKSKKFNEEGKEVVRKPRTTKPKDPVPITGPFECLQPSTLVEDGVCHQIFFSCCEYSIHFRDEHTRRKSGNRCQVCEKPLIGGQGFDVAAYNCMVCGAGFDSNKDLQVHTATNHVKLKPFECTLCHKRFTQQGGLQQHMRMHTGVRPFPCTYCDKAFTQKSGLDQHLRIHTKVRPYRCVICSKSFAQSVHVKQHMRTHTNVSPFQCAICEKRFKQSSHLNYHLRNHNKFNMTDEQKAKYEQLIKQYNINETTSEPKEDGRKRRVLDTPREVVRRKPKQNNVVVLTREDGELVTLQQDQYMMVEDDSSQSDEAMLEQSEQDHQEQLLAEQSIQVETETYILGDDGDEWEVQVDE